MVMRKKIYDISEEELMRMNRNCRLLLYASTIIIVATLIYFY